MRDGPAAIVIGGCYACGRTFGFNPHRVPSYQTDPTDYASREPICPTCIVVVNERRRAAGLDEWPVHPDSYEPILAAEL